MAGEAIAFGFDFKNKKKRFLVFNHIEFFKPVLFAVLSQKVSLPVPASKHTTLVHTLSLPWFLFLSLSLYFYLAANVCAALLRAESD